MDKKEYVQHIVDKNFEAMVLKSNKLALVDFWAPWCGPCRAIGPVLEEIAKDYQDKINVVKMNVDDNPETSSLYGVRSIPTLIIIKNGQVVETRIGMIPKNQLTAFIDKHLN